MRSLVNLLVQTLRQLQKTIITVISIVSMAKVLGYSGMVASVAITLADATGCFYPAFAPLIGALGTFITAAIPVPTFCSGCCKNKLRCSWGSAPYGSPPPTPVELASAS
jgi:lactate permease